MRLNWAKHDHLSQKILHGIRKNKEVKNKVDTQELGEIEIKHLNKVFFPDEGYTKGDLLKYYDDVSDLMLPYLKDRPQNLNQYPDGITGIHFFHKNIPDHPDFVDSIKIYSESAKRDLNYLICNNKETLLYLANLGCIEINPWNSRTKSLENPDYLIFDLDADFKYFEKLVKVAQTLHQLLEDLEIESNVKTSGKRGIHVYVGLNAKYNFDQTRTFAELIAVTLQNKLPEIINLVRDPEKREDAVYIDYLQNRFGQTTAASYSVRPVIGATVSTPLKWSEVTKKLDPRKFTIKTTRNRIDKFGDLWNGVLGNGIDIEKASKKLT